MGTLNISPSLFLLYFVLLINYNISTICSASISLFPHRNHTIPYKFLKETLVINFLFSKISLGLIHWLWQICLAF